MKGKIISQDQGNYLVSGDDGKRYQFAIWDWLEKNPPRIENNVNFVCKGDSIKSIFPLLNEKQSKRSQMLLAFVCFFVGAFGYPSLYGW
ncbi:hypothetical protein HNQ69_001413 [Bartonella callosciuri]|uniref:TM2 domain-containing protein n=1 Tax=Bartonella callosciuri TaxID=686223 RepID=A0A840NNG9_9HYPH|nr:hypothetical protein [Bartonella callosciuri]